ncbi:MAG TPA: hypothetical protein PLF89_08725 [bacterium]|nr:hypothetical protein [bacterium]HOH07596.1 hypothetical protein [bacterium]
MDLIVGNRIGQLFGYQLPAGFHLLTAFPNQQQIVTMRQKMKCTG